MFYTPTEEMILQNYENAKKVYASLGLDTEAALEAFEKVGMAMLDECKNLPLNAVWDYLCWKKGAGVGMSWLDEMERYEREVQFLRK